MNKKPKLYFKFYQLLKFFYRAIRNFEKQYKYNLGKEILNLTWKCLDLIIEINALPNEKKLSKIKELGVRFDELKIRLRMAQELNLISQKQFVHIQVYYSKEIGEMIGGWLRWSGQNIKINK